MKMLEKITIAAYNKFNENIIGCCEPAWESLPEDFKFRMIEAQKAAIEAMLEPTEELMKIDDDVFLNMWDYNCNTCGGHKFAVEIYIKQVLKE